MKEILEHLFDKKLLSREESKVVLKNIAQGQYNEAEIAAFLSVYIMRGMSVEELAGFREAMLSLCLPLEVDAFDPIDLCGTGGDGKNTFNISTLASFVVAGAGGKVAKHGNYGVSSASGSSNVLEYFGYEFTNEADILKKELDEVGLCFLHAPLFHPAMKNVAPVRQKLAVKTFFNMLGPMVNPTFPRRQMVGVFDLEIARLYHYLYQKLDKRFSIIHSLDGFDEISLTGEAKWVSNEGERIVTPAELGMEQVDEKELHGGSTVEEAAGIFQRILNGEGTRSQNEVVIANAGIALHCIHPDRSIEDCIGMARESLESGEAMKRFKKLLGEH